MSAPTPLAGIRVVEFTHMVMGPVVGHILAGLGAEVVRIEPIGGDKHAPPERFGRGYFPMYNRGKQSICLDLKDPQGLTVARDLIARSDVLVENFRPGALDRLGLDYDTCAAANPRLVYCSEKRLPSPLPGPLRTAHRARRGRADDGRAAYMTERAPRAVPCCAGASVIDVTRGMFGVSVCWPRSRTPPHGRGQKVCRQPVFETTNLFRRAAHLAIRPLPGAPRADGRNGSGWAIYECFRNEGPNTGLHRWRYRCAVGRSSAASLRSTPCGRTRACGRKTTPGLAARDRIIPESGACRHDDAREVIARLDGSGLPFAPRSAGPKTCSTIHTSSTAGSKDVTLDNGTEGAPADHSVGDGRRADRSPQHLPNRARCTRGARNPWL